MYYLLRDCSMYSLSIHVLPPNHYKFTIFSRFYFEITILFPKSPSIYYRFREINKNSLSASRFHNEFTVCFVNPLQIHIFRQITMHLLSATRNHYIVHNSLSRELTFFELTFFFTISLGIQYLFPEITTNTLY